MGRFVSMSIVSSRTNIEGWMSRSGFRRSDWNCAFGRGRLRIGTMLGFAGLTRRGCRSPRDTSVRSGLPNNYGGLASNRPSKVGRRAPCVAWSAWSASPTGKAAAPAGGSDSQTASSREPRELTYADTGRYQGRARHHFRRRSSFEGIAGMTKYQGWKLYGRYVLRRIRKRMQTLLSRVIPGIAPAGKRRKTKRDSPIDVRQT